MWTVGCEMLEVREGLSEVDMGGDEWKLVSKENSSEDGRVDQDCDNSGDDDGGRHYESMMINYYYCSSICMVSGPSLMITCFLVYLWRATLYQSLLED
jgi:hypothetical protein